MSYSLGQDDLLRDSYGRRISYLRLSVTDRCNFRCVYCMAEKMSFMPRTEVLDFDEMAQIVGAFVALGVNKVRITGGEPLVCHHLDALVHKLNIIPGLNTIALSTNGARLPQHALSLKKAGVRSVNISLDTLESSKFRKITRTGNLDHVLAGIDAALSAGFERIKINSVILHGYNDEEVLSLVNFARRKEIDISFIEEMPLGVITEHQRSETYHSSEKVRAAIEHHHPLSPCEFKTGGPSRYYTMSDSNIHIGFISPHSNNFCSACNRVRLTATGRLLTCLGNEQSVDLRAVVRAPDFDPTHPVALQRAIQHAMTIKPWGHAFNYRNNHAQVLRWMNTTGG